MTEQVQTGGVMKFDYSGHNDERLDPERKDAIEIGYAQADERKKKEKRKKIMMLILLFFILLMIILFFMIKN